jgi:hypothetical protein
MMLDNLDTAIGFAVVMLLLSMLVTVFVQIVVGIFNLRGQNLAWGVRKLLTQIDPGLAEEKAAQIAKQVLEHSAVSHTWRKTTAIRPDELVLILKDVATGVSGQKLELAGSGLQKLVSGAADQKASQSLTGQVVLELTKIFPDRVAAVQDAVGRALKAENELEKKVETWFDTVMNRTSERFRAQTGLFTVILGFGVAAWLHVDSLHLVRELSANKELRAAFVNVADQALKQSEQTQKLLADSVMAASVIRELAGSAASPAQAATLKTVPVSVVTLQQGRDWLAKSFAGDPKLADLVGSYDERFQKASVERIEKLVKEAGSVRASLDERLLKVRPADLSWTSSHVLGVLITGLLLGLGAPFWFNALRNLSNLRPALAGKVEQQKTRPA